jgi:hypothetical protein
MKKGATLIRWTAADIDLLTSTYEVSTDDELAAALNRTAEAVQTKRMELKLIKNEAFANGCSKKSQFKKGHVPVIVPHHLKAKRVDGWTDQEVAYLIANWETQTSTEVGAAIGRGRTAVASKASDMGITKSPEAAKEIRRRSMAKTPRKDGWSVFQLNYLKEKYADYSSAEIADVIGRSAAAVKTKAADLGLKTSATALSRLGKRPNAGMYQNGGPIGTITTRTTKDGVATKWIKLGTKEWQQLHRYNWQQAGNTIPDGHALMFIDGDRAICEVYNLRLKLSDQEVRTQGDQLRRAARKAQKILLNDERKRQAQFKRSKKIALKEDKRIADSAQKSLSKEEKQIAKATRAKEAQHLKILKSQFKRLAKRVTEIKEKTPKVKLEVVKRTPIARPAIRVARAGRKSATQKKQENDLVVKERATQKAIQVEQVKQARREKERKRIVADEETKKKLPTRVIDYSQLIALRIDHRTVVYIKPGTDIERIQAKYGAKAATDYTNAFGHNPPEYQF